MVLGTIIIHAYTYMYADICMYGMNMYLFLLKGGERKFGLRACPLDEHELRVVERVILHIPLGDMKIYAPSRGRCSWALALEGYMSHSLNSQYPP